MQCTTGSRYIGIGSANPSSFEEWRQGTKIYHTEDRKKKKKNRIARK
jgi:hypothetical protein